jgi:hypothetical protein
MIRKLRTLIGRPATLTTTGAQQAFAEGALLLDVRERNEWQTGHAPQARHIALGQLEEHLAELPADRLIVAAAAAAAQPWQPTCSIGAAIASPTSPAA